MRSDSEEFEGFSSGGVADVWLLLAAVVGVLGRVVGHSAQKWRPQRRARMVDLPLGEKHFWW
jgi:hypothetical protein